MKKVFLLVSIVLFVGALVLVLYLNLFGYRNVSLSSVNLPTIKNRQGIEIFLPKPGERIASPLKVVGAVNDSGWAGFEGQVGTVKLFDGNNRELASAVLGASTEWTKLPIHFEATLNFESPGNGSGRLIFHNENPSGDPVRQKTLTMPVRFQ